MTDAKPFTVAELPEGIKTFEVIVTFVPQERALLRMAAMDEETVRKAVAEMSSPAVRDLVIESIQEVEPEAPIPEDYEPMGEEIPEADETGKTDKKVLH